MNRTKVAINRNSKIYLKSDLKHTSLNTSNSKCKSNKESTLAKNSSKPNLLSDELLQKTKDTVIGTQRNCNIKNGDCNWNRCESYFSHLFEFVLRGCLHVNKMKSHSWMKLIVG